MSSITVHKDFEECREQRQRQTEWAAYLLRLAAQQICGVLPVTHDSSPSQLSMRPLYASEVATLQNRCHCRCQDWSLLRLVLSSEHHRLDQSQALTHLVSNSTFEGTVILIIAKPGTAKLNKKLDSQRPWDKFPLGLHDNLVVSNSIIDLRAKVYRNSMVSNTFVDADAVVMNCGHISTDNLHDELAGDLSITVGAESGGGRQLDLTAESTMMDVCKQLTTACADSTKSTTTRQLTTLNIIGSNSVLRDTPTVSNVYLYPTASIEAASSVKSAVLFPGATIRNGCTVSKVLMQWDSSISDSSTVSDTLLMEQAHAGPASVCASSILGPDVHISTGEVHASVLGPNTNAHHQSLVISVLWPMGRGNVGYGANVGSNHTGRIPDQETVSGEGVFWGLSTVIKFPVDLSHAPYSIVAAGTTLAPQRVTMPFSLIVDGGGGMNQIIPGWVLRNSPYTLSRSEKKYATRRKARRHDPYTGWKILRPETIAMCLSARQALENVGSQPQSSYRSDRAIPGIGANELSEKARVAGIKAYSDCIHRFALQGLLSFLNHAKKSGESLDDAIANEFSEKPTAAPPVTAEGVNWPIFPWDADESNLWNYQRSLLVNEFALTPDTIEWACSLLHKLIVLEQSYAAAVYKCKKRDDTRGIRTIPGYKDSHVLAEDDPVVAEVRADAQQTEDCIVKLLQELDPKQRSKL